MQRYHVFCVDNYIIYHRSYLCRTCSVYQQYNANKCFGRLGSYCGFAGI